jgi:hypothetical protein
MLDDEQDEEPRSVRSTKAYERGVAWANETFDQWLDAGRVIPPDLPLTESDASTTFGAADYPDPVMRTHMVLVAFDAARLRWTRLVSLGMTRESSLDLDATPTDASGAA